MTNGQADTQVSRVMCTVKQYGTQSTNLPPLGRRQLWVFKYPQPSNGHLIDVGSSITRKSDNIRRE